MNNIAWLDGALYPDMDVPDKLASLAERVDFLARLCAASDLGYYRPPSPSQRSAGKSGRQLSMRVAC